MQHLFKWKLQLSWSLLWWLHATEEHCRKEWYLCLFYRFTCSSLEAILCKLGPLQPQSLTLETSFKTPPGPGGIGQDDYLCHQFGELPGTPILTQGSCIPDNCYGHHGRCPCKNILSGVKFSRLNTKTADILLFRDIFGCFGVFLVNFRV